ncbi:GNAT family N-acetyltransferase [Dactylosporangium sp. NBC_01737]|uniref:GNAT family N-acetyltransferase n=1 Tax=Dactylosporangium sp. NBC_01737 TaxID=2975959 RepID=UPI002E1404F5|nr:GNAT family N-acetyltransferase [Dactylosporangium sp. NBC_01737]
MNIALRPWREDDTDAVVEACSDPVTARFMPFLPQPYTREDAMAFFRHKPGDLAVVDPATDGVLGAVGSTPRGEGIAEVGYWVMPAARRKGVASAALEGFATRLFESGLQRLYLVTALTNGASQRVAVAGGFVREGVARGSSRTRDGGWQDMVVWARLAGDPAGPSARVLPDLPGGALTDGVVTLRPIVEEDGPSTYQMRSLPDVSGRSVVSTPMDPAVVTRQCAESASKWLAGQRAETTIRDATDSTYLGEIALFYSEPALREAMIGYSLTPEARGKGYAARAARLITDWGFEIGMARMIAGTAPDNIASQRVLEAAGYHREGLQRSRLPGPDGTRIDNVQFAKLRPAAT